MHERVCLCVCVCVWGGGSFMNTVNYFLLMHCMAVIASDLCQIDVQQCCPMPLQKVV